MKVIDQLNYRTVEKFCDICNTKLRLRSNRDIERKKFCSRKCLLRSFILVRKANAKKRTVRLKVLKIPPPQKYCKLCNQKICHKNKNNICLDCRNKIKTKEGHVTFNCENCGKVCTRKRYTYQIAKNHLCSQACRNEFKSKNAKTKFITPCKNCSKQLHKFKCQIQGKNIFCSRSCASKYYGTLKRTTTHLYKGGKCNIRKLIKSSDKYKKWVYEVFKKYNFKCNRCGGNKILNAHHIKRFGTILTEFLNDKTYATVEDKYKVLDMAFEYQEFWDVNNGECLCRACHQKEHPEVHLNW